MAQTSKIEWTDATWNPITGCTLVSEGCRHCYAATLAATRLKNHPSRAGLARINAPGEAKFTGEVRLNEQWLDQPLRWRRPRRIFVCAHSDLFHESVPDEWIDRVFAVMALAPQHTFQVLTKRPGRMQEYLSRPKVSVRIGLDALGMVLDAHAANAKCNLGAGITLRTSGNPGAITVWPLPNVWLGTSIEDQATADARIPRLLATPAAVRFVSAEPLLGQVILDDMCDGHEFYDALRGNKWHDCDPPYIERGHPKLDWIIVGGESGPGARPMHPDWARALRDQCVAAGVPYFFKQWGEWGPGSILMTTGEPIFCQIRDFQTWVNKVRTWGNGGICMDAAGRQCKIAADFMRARDEGTFPVTIIHKVGKKAAGRLLDGRTWDQMPGQEGA